MSVQTPSLYQNIRSLAHLSTLRGAFRRPLNGESSQCSQMATLRILCQTILFRLTRSLLEKNSHLIVQPRSRISAVERMSLRMIHCGAAEKRHAFSKRVAGSRNFRRGESTSGAYSVSPVILHSAFRNPAASVMCRGLWEQLSLLIS